MDNYENKYIVRFEAQGKLDRGRCDAFYGRFKRCFDGMKGMGRTQSVFGERKQPDDLVQVTSKRNVFRIGVYDVVGYELAELLLNSLRMMAATNRMSVTKATVSPKPAPTIITPTTLKLRSVRQEVRA